MIKRFLLRLKIRRIVKAYEGQMIKMLEDAVENPSVAAVLEHDCEVSKVMIKRKDNAEKK
jgi:hypothetical protein